MTKKCQTKTSETSALAVPAHASVAMMGQLMEADVAAVCGPRNRHDLDRAASRHDTAGSVTLGGRRVRDHVTEKLRGPVAKRMLILAHDARTDPSCSQVLSQSLAEDDLSVVGPALRLTSGGAPRSSGGLGNRWGTRHLTDFGIQADRHREGCIAHVIRGISAVLSGDRRRGTDRLLGVKGALAVIFSRTGGLSRRQVRV